MYYEGTDRCDGLSNLIFHATSDNWHGPWQKQGRAIGLGGNTSGSGLSWPNIYIENDQLYLYYTDGSVRLLAARAISDNGHNFIMENNGQPVSPDLVNEGDIKKIDGRYVLIHDTFQTQGIKFAESNDKFNFPFGTLIIDRRSNGWENNGVFSPIILPAEEIGGNTDRIYYNSYNAQRVFSINVCTINLNSMSTPTPTPTPTPTSTPKPKCAAPNRPTLQSVCDPDYKNDFICTWYSVSGATQYRGQIDDNSDFSSPIINSVSSLTKREVLSQPDNVEYYCRARVETSSSCEPPSDWSSTASIAACPSPTPTSTPTLPGDINGDGVVNIQDYVLLSNVFGTNDEAADLDGNGIVNIQDFIILSNNFGKQA